MRMLIGLRVLLELRLLPMPERTGIWKTAAAGIGRQSRMGCERARPRGSS